MALPRTFKNLSLPLAAGMHALPQSRDNPHLCTGSRTESIPLDQPFDGKLYFAQRRLEHAGKGAFIPPHRAARKRMPAAIASSMPLRRSPSVLSVNVPFTGPMGVCMTMLYFPSTMWMFLPSKVRSDLPGFFILPKYAENPRQCIEIQKQTASVSPVPVN